MQVLARGCHLDDVLVQPVGRMLPCSLVSRPTVPARCQLSCVLLLCVQSFCLIATRMLDALETTYLQLLATAAC